MARWHPGTRERIADAALALYIARGYEPTTIADIAERAGITPRTFFRHFADKRETLFGNEVVLQDQIVAALEDTPSSRNPLDAAIAAYDAVGDVFARADRSKVARRADLIASTPALEEREALKLAQLSDAIAQVLARRGADVPAAHLLADVSVAVYVHASRLWTTDPHQSFSACLALARAELVLATHEVR